MRVQAVTQEAEMGNSWRLGLSTLPLKSQKTYIKYTWCLTGRPNTFFNRNKYRALYCKVRNSEEKHHSTKRIELELFYHHPHHHHRHRRRCHHHLL